MDDHFLPPGAVEDEFLPPGAERRLDFRALWPIHKTLQGELYLDSAEPERVYLHVVDISRGGLGVNSHRELPKDHEFRMKLPLEGFGTREQVLDFHCRVAWKKWLLGGTWGHGLQFTNLGGELISILEDIVSSVSDEGRRRRFRLNRMLPVAVREASDRPWLGERYASGLTLETVTVRLDNPLPPGQEVEVRLALEFGLPSLLVPATVRSSMQVAGGKHQMEMEFDILAPEQGRLLRTYIDRCMKER